MKNQDQKECKTLKNIIFSMRMRIRNASYDWIYSRVRAEAQYHAVSRLAMAIVSDLHEHLPCWLAGKKKGKRKVITV